MKPSTVIKPITYLKSHTAELVREVNETRDIFIITQNGEARAIMQDIATYEQTQETLALLKLLSQGRQSAREGRSKPVRQVIGRMRSDLAKSEA